MSTHANMVKMTVSSVSATPSTGKGDITLNAASTGFQSFADAYGANATVDILITKGAEWEVARNCTYTHSGTTLTRGTWEDSSNGTGAIVADNTAVVSVVATAAFGNATENFLGAWGALSGENSITGTATAVIGRLNVCSGTSANYTVTLPAVSGNAGKYIGFRMAPSLTKLVTLDGNSSETIDGATIRIMWANETALLYCDGSTWTKVAGKSIPMTCGMYKAADQTVAASSNVRIDLDSTISGDDNTGLMADATNKRINIVRDGNYVVSGVISYDGLTGRADCRLHKNTADLYIAVYYYGGAAAQPAISARVPLTTSDAVQLYASQFSGSSKTVYGGASNTQLYVTEVPSW